MSRTALSHRRAVELRRHLPAPVARAVAVLNAAPQDIVGSHRDGFWAPAEAHAVLGAQLLPGTLVTRSVRIGFGPLLEDEDVMVLPVWWEDDEHPHLFPTFDGGLELGEDDGGTELRLAGSYEPPLGGLGRFADGVAGHRFVMDSLARFVDDIGARLTTAALDGAATVSAPPVSR
jgi:hypothetical protein